MALPAQIGGSAQDQIFLATHVTRTWKVADMNTDPTGRTAKDVSGWDLSFIVQHYPSGVAIVSKTIGAGLEVLGTFDLDISVSTQVIQVTLEAEDLSAENFGATGGVFYYSLRRIGLDVLAYGPFIVQ